MLTIQNLQLLIKALIEPYVYYSLRSQSRLSGIEHKMLKKTGNQKTMKEAQIIQWPNEKRCKTNNDSQNTMQKD
jgi:hypothetical protein